MKQFDEMSIRRLSIFELRDMAREVGVRCPTSLKKEDLVKQILSIMSGESVPEMPKSRQGRPPKNKSKIILSTEDNLCEEFDGESAKNNKPMDNMWLFCDGVDEKEEYNERYDYREGEGYIENINDRQYLFPTQNCSDPKNAILVPKSIEVAYPFRAGDFVKCLYKNSDTYDYKILNKVKNEEDITKSRLNYDSLGRVKPSKNIKIFSKTIKIGEKIVFKVDNFLGYADKIADLQKDNKDCYFVNLVLDALLEDNYVGNETFCTFVGDSTKRNCFAVGLTIDRVKRLVEEGKNVVLCVNELLKIVKYQNFLLGYEYGLVKSNSFSSVFNLFRLAGVYDNGASVTFVAIIKNDKLTSCGNYLLSELENLNVHIYDGY